MDLKEKIENHPVIWTLGMLVAGFLAGIGAYSSILSIAKLQVVSSDATILADDQVAVSQSKNEELQKAARESKDAKLAIDKFKQDFDALKGKEHFLSLYLRYFLAVYQADRVNREIAEQSLVRIVQELQNKPVSHSYEVSYGNGIATTQATVGKGAATSNSTIRFTFDDSIWPLPEVVGTGANLPPIGPSPKYDYGIFIPRSQP